MRRVLFFMVLALTAAAIAAGDEWSDFWDRVAVERARTAPSGAQIRSVSIAAFESGRHSSAAAPEDGFDSWTRTWMRSNALAKFLSEPPAGLTLFLR